MKYLPINVGSCLSWFLWLIWEIGFEILFVLVPLPVSFLLILARAPPSVSLMVLMALEILWYIYDILTLSCNPISVIAETKLHDHFK